MKQNGLKVKGIFLDLDGTIVDSTEAYMEAARTAFQSIGQKPPETKTALKFPEGLEQGISLADITNGETKKFLSIYFKTYYLVSREKTKLIPNVEQPLKPYHRKPNLP